MAGIEPDRSEEALNRANRGFKRFSKLLVKQAGKPTMNALASTGPILTSQKTMVGSRLSSIERLKNEGCFLSMGAGSVSFRRVAK